MPALRVQLQARNRLSVALSNHGIFYREIEVYHVRKYFSFGFHFKIQAAHRGFMIPLQAHQMMIDPTDDLETVRSGVAYLWSTGELKIPYLIKDCRMTVAQHLLTEG